MSLRGLRTFCVAARHESFSDAASALFITPSAVSHQIKNLEEELHLKLFDRSARDMRLTGAGESIYQQIHPLIDQVDAIVGSFKNDVVRSAIRLSVQPFFASEYFVPRLGEFTEKHPEIDIQVGASDESAEARQADADLAIRLYRVPPQGVECELLTPLRLVVAGSPSMKKSIRVKNSRIDSPLPIIVHESMPNAWSQWSAASGIKLTGDEKITRLDSMIAVVRAVEQGLGAALVPIPMANQWFEQGTISQMFPYVVESDLSYYVTWTKSSARKAGVEPLCSWIMQRFSG